MPMIQFGKWTPSIGDFEAPENVSDVDGMYPMVRGYEPWHSYQTARPASPASANNAMCIYGSASPQIAMVIAGSYFVYANSETATSVWMEINGKTSMPLLTWTNSGGNHVMRTSANVNMLDYRKAYAVLIGAGLNNSGTWTVVHGNHTFTSYGARTSTANFVDRVYFSRTVISETDAVQGIVAIYNANGTGWSMSQFRAYVVMANSENFPVAGAPLAVGGERWLLDLDAPFRAGTCGVINEFVVMGDLTENASGERTRNKIWWSAIGCPFDWVVDSATQCGNAVLPGGSGEVRGVVSGEYGLLLCANEIYRMLYVGLPTIFQITIAFRNIGVLCKHAWAQYRDMLFMATSTGFKMIIDGSVVHDIGKEDGIDDFFQQDLDQSAVSCIHCAVDGSSTRVFWSYQSNRTGITTQDRILCFDWRLQKWSKRTDDDQSLVGNVIYSDSVSSGNSRIGVVDNTNSVIWAQTATAFSSNENYVLETAEYEHNEGSRTFIRGIRPVYTGGSSSTPSVGVYHRDRFGVSATVTAGGDFNVQGEATTRLNARYTKYRINFGKKNFNNLLGLQVKASSEGKL